MSQDITYNALHDLFLAFVNDPKSLSKSDIFFLIYHKVITFDDYQKDIARQRRLELLGV